MLLRSLLLSLLLVPAAEARAAALRALRLSPSSAQGSSEVLHSHELEEQRQGDQRHATEQLQGEVGGLLSWAARAASLQQLSFLGRFQTWLQRHSGSTSAVEAALEKIMGSELWSMCAAEDASCFCGSGVLRYGLGGAWAYKNFTGKVTCSNNQFGGDPSPGVVKQCQCRDDSRAAWLQRGKPFAPENLLWSCQEGEEEESDEEVEGNRGPRSLLHKATKDLCAADTRRGLLEVYLDPRFNASYKRWVNGTGWLEEAYVTYMAGKRNSNFEWMATNLIRSLHLFSTRPLVLVDFDSSFDAPESWLAYPNLLVYRMRPAKDVSQEAAGVSFNFNKIRAMIAARVLTGIQVDLDQVVFAGMDSLFQATRRESTADYPLPVLPVHWMARDGGPGEPYYEYSFKSYGGNRSMRWNHAHPTWSFWSLPFLSQLLSDRLSARPAPAWMEEDEDMLNVMLWQRNATKAWCKFDLEPALFTMEWIPPNNYYDPKWYPTGVPLLFFGAHNTKQVEATDWLLTLMARCAEPSMRSRAQPFCEKDVRKACSRSELPPMELAEMLQSSEEIMAKVCCCVRRREDTPIFWQGRYFKETAEVPELDERGHQRRCLLP